MEDEPGLGKIDWDDLYPRVLVAAGRLAKGAPNRRALAEDLAHNAILKTQAGDRNWDRRTPILDHLVSVMRSDLYHLRKSYTHKNVIQDEGTVINFTDHLNHNPEDSIIVDNFIDYIDDRNADAAIMARLMLNQRMKTSRELSFAMKVTISYADRTKSRLRSIALDYLGYDSSRKNVKPFRSLLQVLDEDVSNDG